MRSGRRLSYKDVRCIYVKNNLNHGRIGFAVSRKYGNAVQRQNFKRHWREVFRCNAVKMTNLDILIIPMTPFCKNVNIQEHALLLLSKLTQKNACL